jgi:lysophospholipase L1-like esterase
MYTASLHAVDDGWLNREVMIQQVTENVSGVPYTAAGGACVEYTFSMKSRSGATLYYPEQTEPCPTYTARGVGSGQYYYERGERYAGVIRGTNSSLFYHLPNTDTLIELRNGQRPYKRVNLYPDFPQTAVVGTVNGRDMTYRPQNPRPVTDRAGNTLNVSSSVRFSRSGDWMLLYSNSQGALRVDTASGSVLPFGLRLDGPEAYAISPSGRFAVVAYAIAKTVELYDLNTCTPTPQIIQLPTDCSSVDLTDQLKDTSLPYQRVMNARFLSETQLELDLRYSDGSIDRYQVGAGGIDEFTNASYLALGDSFASGEGDRNDAWYLPGTNEPGVNMCHTSLRSYPYIIGYQLGYDEYESVACSGAVTAHVLSEDQYASTDGLPGSEEQKQFISDKHSIVTLSIGGNDIGFADKLTECVLGPGTCKYAEDGPVRSQMAQEIASLHKTLEQTYTNIAAKSNGAKVFVIGYPQFVTPDGDMCGLNVRLNRAERRFIHKGVVYLNAVIKAAALRAGVHYIDAEEALAGRNLCSVVTDEQMVVNGLTFGDGSGIPVLARALNGLMLADLNDIGVAKESYHPNELGHQLLANAILEQADGDPSLLSTCATGFADCKQDIELPIPDDYWGANAQHYVEGINNAIANPIEVIPSYRQLLQPDQTIRVEHLQPHSTVRVELHSEPIKLGEYVVGGSGVLEQLITLPQDTPVGFHTLRLFGFESTGEPIEHYQQVFVPGPQGDIDANGIDDSNQYCAFVPDSGVDIDEDGIDDACDGSYIATTTMMSPSEEEPDISETNTTTQTSLTASTTQTTEDTAVDTSRNPQYDPPTVLAERSNIARDNSQPAQNTTDEPTRLGISDQQPDDTLNLFLASGIALLSLGSYLFYRKLI